MATDQLKFDASRIIPQNLKFYHSIKPKISENSYTVIATLNDANTSQLLALATGTQASLRKYDNDIEDCHAESLLKRAYKRYILDRIISALALADENNSEEAHATDHVKTRLSEVIEQINQQELVLFISQFPCGLITRFQGPEPVDEETGAVIVRKPGRGQMIDGKIAYVRRDTCLGKIKRWTSSYGLQGKSIMQNLSVKSRLIKLIIGDCEPDLSLDYTSSLNMLSHELSTSKTPIQFELVRMRHKEFTYESSDKQPLPVATLWWASARYAAIRDTLEYVVDGRRLGITKKQCLMNKNDLKLRSSDYWLRSDLKRIDEAT